MFTREAQPLLAVLCLDYCEPLTRQQRRGDGAGPRVILDDQDRFLTRTRHGHEVSTSRATRSPLPGRRKMKVTRRATTAKGPESTCFTTGPLDSLHKC